VADQCTYLVEPGRLQGEVTLSGAKNSALRLLAASLLTDEPVRLDRFPTGLRDAQVHLDMLEVLGKSCVATDGHVAIEEPGPVRTELVWDGRSIRNTLLILGALTTRFGEGAVPMPGGCAIGERKIDLHEHLLREMGAKVWFEGDVLRAEGRLHAADLSFPIRSTGATENALLCASRCEGTTTIRNPHVTPEIRDLMAMLRTMGAGIEVFGTERIEVTGTPELRGATFTVRSDRMEAITWVIGALITEGEIEIDHFPFDDLVVPMTFLEEAGARFYRDHDRLLVRSGWRSPIEISTGAHPSIHSDMQPLFGVYATTTHGTSHIVDMRYPDRFDYADELRRMGAECHVGDGGLRVEGPSALRGTTVRASDLRAGAALTLAGLVADGVTRVEEAWQMERGYDGFVTKARALGATIERHGDAAA
jgi:UDP-N-acetylglucosamine 1-carboxyvinyltransferase